MNRLITLIVTITIFLSIPQMAYSASTAPDSTKKVGIGIQGAPFPVIGLAVVYNLNERLGLQAVAKTGYDVDILALRALYRFKNEPKYNTYASGLLGIFRDDAVSTGIFAPDETDVAAGFGIGGGFEYFFSGLPNVGWNLELDFIHIAFEEKWWEYDYETFSLVMIGLGAHYYFK